MKKKTPFLDYHKIHSEDNVCSALCWTLRKTLTLEEKVIFDSVSPDGMKGSGVSVKIKQTSINIIRSANQLFYYVPQ